MKLRAIFLFFLVLTMFLSLIPQTYAETSDKFIYFIDGKNIIDISPDVVIGSDSVLLVHSHNILRITYTCGNQTYYDDKTIVKKVVILDVYDNAHLVITDINDNVIVDCVIHTLNIGNFFEYVFPLKYQQLAISVCLAFIVSILLVYALFVNRETRIL